MQSRQDAFTNGSRISGRVEGSAEIGMLSALSQLTPSSEPARSTRVVRHVSAFSTAPMTPALCGRRHFLPFWSAGARLSPGGLTGTWGIEVPEAQAGQEQDSALWERHAAQLLRLLLGAQSICVQHLQPYNGACCREAAPSMPLSRKPC